MKKLLQPNGNLFLLWLEYSKTILHLQAENCEDYVIFITVL